MGTNRGATNELAIQFVDMDSVPVNHVITWTLTPLGTPFCQYEDGPEFCDYSLPAMTPQVSTITDTEIGVSGTGSKLLQYRIKTTYTDSGDEYSNTRLINPSKVFFSLTAEPEKAEDFMILVQNYPNPFNPSTTFKFTMPKDDYVNLKIYNLQGQEIAELIDGYRNVGEHSITFDAGDLAAGTYFYTLSSGKFSETKKFTLVK